MKTTTCILAFAALLAVHLPGYSQGFINLNFESAKIVVDPNSPDYPFGITVTNALPGWAVFGSMSGDITYNDPSTGATWVTLFYNNGSQISGICSVQLEGLYSSFPATISQTGMVPAGTESLFFEAQHSGTGALQVSLGGQKLSLSSVGTGPNYTLYGANISNFAGLASELVFWAASTGDNIWTIDNIQFSSSPVPEPGVFSLAGLGALAFGWRRWQRHCA